jgi:uncharacterized Zn finger protein
VLGEKDRAELARRVEDRARTAEPDVFGRTPFGIRVLREQLAEISGDVDQYVSVLAEHLYAAPQYRKIVDVLWNAGRVAEAERWAQQGLEIGNSIGKGKLRDAYVDLLLARGATDEAFAPRWQLFDGNPIKTTYNDLRRAAERIGDWPGVRDKAVSGSGREVTAGQPAHADHLIGVYLDEGDLDEAWQVAVDHAEDLFDSRWQLIELRQPTHPGDVIEPWQRLVQRRLDASTDKYRYGKAVKMLRRLRDAYHAAADVTGFGSYLDHLREQHKRKTSFVAKLDHANL